MQDTYRFYHIPKKNIFETQVIGSSAITIAISVFNAHGIAATCLRYTLAKQ